MKILEKERKLKGLSPTDLSEKLGVSQQTIYNWTNGVCTPTAQYAGALKKLGFSDAACLKPSQEVEV